MITPNTLPPTEPAVELGIATEPLAAAIGQQALETTVSIPSVEDFRVSESLGARALRLYNRVVHGPYARGSYKPNRYDIYGYTASVTDSVEALVVANNNEMSPTLYSAAEQTSASLRAGTEASGMRYYDYARNQANGARDLGTLRAITRNPAFTLTDPARAVSILTGLGDHEPSVAKGMLTIYDPELGCTVLRPEVADKALDITTTLIDQDGIWGQTPPNEHGYQRPKAEWALNEISEALGLVAQSRPMESFGARINMLVRNAEGANEAKVVRNLVYGFTTIEEKTALADLARDPEANEVVRRLAADILGGRWDRTFWAI